MTDAQRTTALIYQLRTNLNTIILRKWCRDSGIERDYDGSEDPGQPFMGHDISGGIETVVTSEFRDGIFHITNITHIDRNERGRA